MNGDENFDADGREMSRASSTTIPTENGSSYLQRLCKHWSHSLEVEFDKEGGQIRFPRDRRGADWPGDAIATLSADAKALTIHLEASNEEHRALMEEVLEKHLQRFAFREGELVFDWRADGAAGAS